MYKALTSFSGVISMSRGETRELSDINLINDLLKAGYIENIEPQPAIEQTKTKPKKTRRGRKANNEN